MTRRPCSRVRGRTAIAQIRSTREILASLGTLEWERHSYYITVHVYCNVACARNFPNREDPSLFLLLSCCFRGRLEAAALLFSWVTLVSQH